MREAKMVQYNKNRDAISDRSIGEIVQAVLSVAKSAQRITLGFSDAIKLLSKTPDEAQFCFLAEPRAGDSATHMNEVLLQAFCYEHGIYIIKVDSASKLAHILDTLNANETCVLIRKSSINCAKHEDKDEWNDKNNEKSATSTMETGPEGTEASTIPATAFHSKEEDILVNFCENSWHNIDYCTVKLPDLR